MKQIITNNPNGYPELRNIITKENDFVLKKDIFSFGLKFMHKITGKGYHPFWKGFYYNPFDSKTPCHFFNTINLGANSWKLHFETTVPRLGKAPRWCYNLGVRKLASDNCKEIIAISNCAYHLQLRFLEAQYPNYLEVIKRKMVVKWPPQEPLITKYEDKVLPNHQIVFTIVGADFFRKGGLEILQVFEDLIPNNDALCLNIVSSMNYGDYATQTNERDLEEALRIISKFPEHIKHYNRLKNSEVLELFKNSHLGLLPTWADSFGYSILEAQACGCPVITTDIRAIPEVNNQDIGWVIEVPKDKNKDGLLASETDRSKFSVIIRNELKQIVLEILNHKESIKIKGELAFQNIIKNHGKNR